TFVAQGVRIRHAADEIEIPRVALLLQKRRPRLEQQGVALIEDDIADTLMEALTAARNGDDDRVVARTKMPFPDALAEQRRTVRDDRFDQNAPGARAVEFERLVGGRDEAGKLLQIDDRLDHADEDQAVTTLQPKTRTDGG